MTPHSWLNPPVWTVRRDGHDDTTMTADALDLELTRQGRDMFTRARIGAALGRGDHAAANDWLAACTSGIRITGQPSTCQTCEGRGEIPDRYDLPEPGHRLADTWVLCPDCDGAA